MLIKRLQRAEVLRYDRQVGALRLLDMTIFKFMLSAIMVAAVGICALKLLFSECFYRRLPVQLDPRDVCA